MTLLTRLVIVIGALVWLFPVTWFIGRHAPWDLLEGDESREKHVPDAWWNGTKIQLFAGMFFVIAGIVGGLLYLAGRWIVTG